MKLGNELIKTHFDFIKGLAEDLFNLKKEKQLLSQGELISTGLFQIYLEEQKIPSVLLPALNFMRVDKDGEPDYYYIEQNLKTELKQLIPNPSLWEGSKKSPYLAADPMTYELLKKFVEKHRKFPTEAESAMWELLKSKKLEGIKFRRQHIIGQYIADFVCLKKKLVIEIDGLIHQLTEVKENDKIRTKWLKDEGYELIRFRNEEVFGDTDNVLKKIVADINLLPDVSLRDSTLLPQGGAGPVPYRRSGG